jgi:hypothetical protein
MSELIKGVFEAPIANLLVISGLFFLAIAVVGAISGKIDPGRTGRIAAGAIGAVLLVTGLAMHAWRTEEKLRILTFGADPQTVAPGKDALLCYGVLGASFLRIDPEIGVVEPLEEKCVAIAPKQTTVYTLLARGREGQEVTRTLEIRVSDPARPPVISHFVASPPSIVEGEDTRLCYGVAGTANARIDPNVGSVRPVGQECLDLKPSRTTTYTLTARSAGGLEVRRSLEVQVSALPRPGPSAGEALEIARKHDTSGNHREAVAWYQKAAALGSADAMFRLGVAHARGVPGVPRDEAVALGWFRKAAAVEFPRAIFVIGDAYQRGTLGLNRDYAEAVRWYRKVAMDNAEAMYRIGEIYAKGGPGVPRDEREGLRWIRKAAEQNHPQAMFMLGLAYERGNLGLTRDLREALSWYRKAASRGVKEARVALTRLGDQ